MKILPFRALRPAPGQAENVASVPYDVVDAEEARAIAQAQPNSLMHVIRAETGLPEETDPYSEAVYRRAFENFQRLQEKGLLQRPEAEPALYAYQQVLGGHRQTGIVALCRVEDYDNGLIKKHEKTRQKKEDDRTRITSVLSANPGPVFLTYRGQETIDNLIESEIATSAPLYDFTAPESGVRHTVWKLQQSDALQRAFEAVPCFYVADGHHRSASAARVGRERREANPDHTGDEWYNSFLCVLFPAAQLRILPYNRLVLDLGGMSPEAFLARMRETYPQLEEDGTGTGPRPGEIRLYLQRHWYRFALAHPGTDDPVANLDAARLQDQVFTPMLGIDDPRTSDRLDFVGGIRGESFLQKAVDSGKAQAAFSMAAVTVEQLMAVSDAEQIMPPKSTWFEPKLLSGLLIHTFEPATVPELKDG